MTYFKEKEKDLIDLISPANTYEFNMEKDTIRNSMELQTAKVTDKPAEMVNKKYMVSRFQELEKNEKEKWMLLIL